MEESSDVRAALAAEAACGGVADCLSLAWGVGAVAGWERVGVEAPEELLWSVSGSCLSAGTGTYGEANCEELGCIEWPTDAETAVSKSAAAVSVWAEIRELDT